MQYITQRITLNLILLFVSFKRNTIQSLLYTKSYRCSVVSFIAVVLVIPESCRNIRIIRTRQPNTNPTHEQEEEEVHEEHEDQ